jgi:alkylation response protein AidB-like acyl-CoA dehydrogenase
MRSLQGFAEGNAYSDDVFLRQALARFRPGLAEKNGERLQRFGRWVAEEADPAAAYTDREAPPRLIETIEGDPAARLIVNPRYAAIHRDAYRHGMVALNHGIDPEPFLLTFAMGYLLSQADISVHCPVTLTGAVALVLDRLAPAELRARWLPPLTRMDGTAWTGGTWATEKDGGSDVGASTTAARDLGGGRFALSGLKFFCSNAGCDVAVATARPGGAPPGSGGLGLYLVPRIRPDGAPNGYRIGRLKEKLGTRGLPTGEIDLLEAYAEEVAPPPRGFKLMMEALEFSRVHNIFAAAGAQRRAFVEALGHAGRRSAFGAPILSYPMVQASLLDMQMELEASLLMAVASADAFDEVWRRGAAAREEDRAWLRLLVAAAKYRTAEQAVRAASAAIEMLGGIGYTEEYATARLLRDAQVLTVWEGPSNIQALELLRILAGPAQGAAILSARIGALLDSLPIGVQDAVPPVRRLLDGIASDSAAVRADPGRGQHLAKRLLDRTADLLCASLLLDEAGHFLSGGDGRAAAVARRYLARRLLHAEPELAAGRAEAVLFYEPVAV